MFRQQCCLELHGFIAKEVKYQDLHRLQDATFYLYSNNSSCSCATRDKSVANLLGVTVLGCVAYINWNKFMNTNNQASSPQLAESQLPRAISVNIDAASTLITEAEVLTGQAQRLLSSKWSDGKTLQYTAALMWIATGRKYIEEFDQSESTEGTFNRSKRVVYICHLALARVKACLAHMYVDHWKGAKGLRQFEVLGEQAVAYAQMISGNNWLYYSPLVLIRPEEPLCQEASKDVSKLLRYGDAAFAYAICLHTQMQICSGNTQDAVGEPELHPNRFEEWPVNATTWLPLAANSQINPLATQEEIINDHIYQTGQDFRENRWLGMDTSYEGRIYPKSRLVGFVQNRGGKSHKHNRAIAQ